MAVVYADLRFTRTSGQVTGDPPEQPAEDWDITYENLTPPKQREDKTQSPRECLRGFPALPPYVTTTLIILSCTLMMVVIGLSVRLSQVSELQLNTAAKLQQLRGEHQDLGSRFTQNNLRKDSMIQTLTENQRQTKQELEKIQATLRGEQEKWTATTQDLQRAVKEKKDTVSTLQRLQDDLLSSENSLRRKQEELSSCEGNLRSLHSEKSTSDSQLAQTRRDLQTSQTRLQQKENTITHINRDLYQERKSLRETQYNLAEKGKESEQQRKKLSALEQRLNEAGKCLTGQACSDILNYDENITDAVHFCPAGWQQIGDLCYYFSTERKTRIDADHHCWSQSATLAKVEDEDSVLKDLITRTAGSYWIGLSRLEKSWVWSDKTIKEDFKARSNQNCAKANPLLMGEICRNPLPWICEKRTARCGSPTTALRCIGERSGILGERYQPL
ncbi:C-type lectin domain family 4 member F-like [Dendropsophus ebraccatus]|uniref:C-type lectin domain family 4 member F-like n=1 Tax=Dendropsophus ebraccatus TaxID=150705 RepID=UPI00383130A3